MEMQPKFQTRVTPVLLEYYYLLYYVGVKLESGGVLLDYYYLLKYVSLRHS